MLAEDCGYGDAAAFERVRNAWRQKKRSLKLNMMTAISEEKFPFNDFLAFASGPSF